MPKLRVHNFGLSLDGYAAGPDQGPEHPLGVGGVRLHEWRFSDGQPTEHNGHDFEAEGEVGVGATIMGRNMFGPTRGGWGDDPWTGWWGDEPPFGHDVFVLTHHPRPPLAMKGGTTFHFVDGSVDDVLAQAFNAADGHDVRLGGGPATVRAFMRAGLVDELHLAVVPILLGAGERLLHDGAQAQYRCVELIPAAEVTHYRLARVEGS